MNDSIIKRFATKAALAQGAAEYIVTAAALAVERSGVFTFVLSGGSTPRTLFELLASPEYSGRMPWSAVHVFWGDERMVPPDHADSNFRMAREALLSHVPLPDENIHRIRGEDGSAKASKDYETEIERFFSGRDAAYSEMPSFDLILLGMGADGHTASLFPGDAATGESVRVASAARAPENMSVGDRVTLTFPVLNACREVLFLVSGESKRDMLGRVLSPSECDALPAGKVSGLCGTYWFVDFDMEDDVKK